MTAELDQALAQLAALETFCRFSQRLPMPPVTMPPDAVRAAGLDPDVWHGLGIVGIWAAVDAFAERRGHHRSELPKVLSPRLKRAWLEIDDLRHLYAHNFGGRPTHATLGGRGTVWLQVRPIPSRQAATSMDASSL